MSVTECRDAIESGCIHLPCSLIQDKRLTDEAQGKAQVVVVVEQPRMNWRKWVQLMGSVDGRVLQYGR
jgi:hypothetical protein